MKQFGFIVAVFFFAGIISVAAQDLIIMKDGNTIEAKVLEITPQEIKYKRHNHLDGPTVVIPIAGVLSIKYENGTTEIINAGAAAVQENAQANAAAGDESTKGVTETSKAIFEAAIIYTQK
ncbi:MAG: hypothetical protein LBH44_07760 [Treponema sp.]|jgi:hypothetical protein|nr:hypothetical protein [Treponema sp.]